MEFEIGDQVMTLTYEGPDKKGTIIIISSSYESGVYYNSYGVRLDGEEGFSYYKSYDLMLCPAAPCTCGAVTAHKPNKPPGHTYYCDLTMENERLFK